MDGVDVHAYVYGHVSHDGGDAYDGHDDACDDHDDACDDHDHVCGLHEGIIRI